MIFENKFKRILITALCFVLIPTFGAAYNYYFTEYLKFTPVTMGYLNFFSTCAYVLAIFLVNSLFRGVNFKHFFMVCMCASILMHSTNYILLFRFNVQWGISDEIFCFSSAALIQLMGELTFMPIYALGSRLCPPGLEATTYSVFTAIFNMAHFCSCLQGAALTKIFGVTRHNFANLWKLTTIQTSCMFIGVVILSFLRFPRIGKKKKESAPSDTFSDLTHQKDSIRLSNIEIDKEDAHCKSVDDGTTLPTKRVNKPKAYNVSETKSLLF